MLMARLSINAEKAFPTVVDCRSTLRNLCPQCFHTIPDKTIVFRWDSPPRRPPEGNLYMVTSGTCNTHVVRTPRPRSRPGLRTNMHKFGGARVHSCRGSAENVRA